MTGFTVPGSVHTTRDGGGGLVVLNRDTGRWHLLNATGAVLFEELRRSGDVDAAVRALAARHPGVAEERIAADAGELVAALVSRGLLDVPPIRGGSGVLMAVVPGTAAPGSGTLAAVAFAAALVLIRLPFRHSSAAVGKLKRFTGRRDATPEEVARWLAAARHVSRWHPGRVACLELSLTAVLIGALQRARVDWCFGFKGDPHTFHAWVEVDGQPVIDVDDDPVAPSYRRVFAV